MPEPAEAATESGTASDEATLGDSVASLVDDGGERVETSRGASSSTPSTTTTSDSSNGDRVRTSTASGTGASCAATAGARTDGTTGPSAGVFGGARVYSSGASPSARTAAGSGSGSPPASGAASASALDLDRLRGVKLRAAPIFLNELESRLLNDFGFFFSEAVRSAVAGVATAAIATAAATGTGRGTSDASSGSGEAERGIFFLGVKRDLSFVPTASGSAALSAGGGARSSTRGVSTAPASAAACSGAATFFFFFFFVRFGRGATSPWHW